jgi:hypothetical protein
VCDGIPIDGSNALMLSWPSGGTTTKVAYIYRLSDDGETYELVRIVCTAGSCQRYTVLRDLDGPDPAAWVPGVTPVPVDVINVALPLAADATADTLPDGSPATDTSSNARRIVVTINGGGGSDGAGGGVNRVSITAGGTDIGTLDPAQVTGPSFLEAKSRCGGPITVVVDDSGSIGSAGAGRTVENAVRGFVSALAGTPTQVQIVKFSTKSSLIDNSSAWNKYYDMTDLAVVNALVGDPANPTPSDASSIIAGGLTQSGGTNWEDAIYRTFYANTTTLTSDTPPRPVNLAVDGDPTTYLPKLVVFFTDGEPTFNRVAEGRADTGPADITSGGPLGVPPRPSNLWPVAIGNTFDQEGWDRSLYLLSPFLNREDVRVIGVGVGGIATNQVTAFDDAYVQNVVNNSGQKRGVVYYNGRAYERRNANPQTVPSNDGNRDDVLPYNTSAEKALGNLMVGVHPIVPGTPYVKATYDAGTDTWTNFDESTNLLITSNFNALASALRQIALGECGGTLTLQTKLTSGALAPADVTYEAFVGDAAQAQTATTSQISRAAAIDMTFPPSSTQVVTVLKPRDLSVAGYSAQSWSCSLRGQPLDPSKWSLTVPGDPAEGITVTVAANEAVSCTMTVATT